MKKFWAMEPTALAAYRKFRAQITAKDSAQLETYLKKLQEFSSGDLTIVDGVAVIPIRGILSNRESFFSFLYDGYLDTYPSIIKMIQSAEADPEVKQIQLRIDSPGGRLDGLFNLLDVIKSASKPIEALIENRADSAAYGIVSQADKITASSEISEVGSIGIGTSFFVDEEIIDITSSDAPKKWPDVTTAEGVNIVKAELDEAHVKFAGIIAEGRAAATSKKVTPDTVNSNFGQGGTMLAEAGLSAGMIDEIIPPPERTSNASFFQNPVPASSGLHSEHTQEKNNIMELTLKSLKDDYPEVHQAAIKSEQDRVAALLKTGKSCGRMDYAIECVENGSRITDDLVQAEFLSARINKKDQENRADDDPAPVDPPDAGDKKPDEDALTKKYLERRKRRGLNGKS